MFVSDNERSKAIGTFTSQHQRKFYSAMAQVFQPMPKPLPGQWLYSMQQKHQSFADYRLPFYNPVTPQRRTIYIQPFGKFDKIFLQKLRRYCEAFYFKMRVECLAQIGMESLKTMTTREQPILQFEKEDGKVVKRDKYYGKQYLAQDYLLQLRKRVPKDAYCVIGLTLKDIYAGKNWNYVYGWASYVARVGIFSFLRWDQPFAEGNKEEIDWDLILYPSLRVMNHQIGHMFGVTHCVYYKCLMNGFMDIDENYKRPFQYCPICLRKLASNIGFSKAERYSKLMNVCKQIGKGESQLDYSFYDKLLGIAEN